MIKLDDALRLIDEAVRPLPAKETPLLEALGCCLAQDVVSPIDVPQFASSAMDGIAVAFADAQKASALKVQGIIPAEQPAKERLRPGYAYRIMTGAPLPEGADTVVPVEELEFAGDIVKIKGAFEPGQHIRLAGNDVKAGQIVLTAKTRLGAIEIGICAGLGMTQVAVHSKPKIALAATGSEIAKPGERLQPGQIYNSNNATLRGLLKAGGWGKVAELPDLKDDFDTLLPALEKLSREHDVIITSGAVSAGEFDYIPKVVQKLGGVLLFHKVAIKPGKPALIAKLGRCWLLSLPGNPVSVVVTYHLYAARVLCRQTGNRTSPPREKAVLAEAVKVDSDRFYVLGAYLERTPSSLMAREAKRYQSGRLSSIIGINGFMFLGEGEYMLPEGTEVEVEFLQ
ncbi:MAG TPA: gephyrin-like molybdotransferase Glp [bacterium]